MAYAANVLSSKRAGFIGLGRLGLCTALKFEQAGWDVLGSDVFPSYVDSINDKTLRSNEPDVERALNASTHLRATLQFMRCVTREACQPQPTGQRRHTGLFGVGPRGPSYVIS